MTDDDPKSSAMVIRVIGKRSLRFTVSPFFKRAQKTARQKFCLLSRLCRLMCGKALPHRSLLVYSEAMPGFSRRHSLNSGDKLCR